MNAKRNRLGMLTPSSNSIPEPVTCAMLAGTPGIIAHFSRFRVTEITLDAPALDQFDPSRILPAADLLADAEVDAMAWNGTSASWLGIERDRSLCGAIGSRTGNPATTECLDSRFRRSHAVAIDVACERRPENIVRVGTGLSVPTPLSVTGGISLGTA